MTIEDKTPLADEPDELIYFSNILSSKDDPAQTLYNCECMLSLLGTKELAGTFREEASVGYGLLMYQVEKSLKEIAENYEFKRKKTN